MTIDIAFSLLVTVPRDFIPKRFLYPPEAVLFASVVWFYRNEKKKKKKKLNKIKRQGERGRSFNDKTKLNQTKSNQSQHNGSERELANK